MYDLKQLVSDLPEVYQPIFNNPSFSESSSRVCGDRLVEITKTYRALETKIGRPLTVLDLGCAQGFFSLSLGALGASVHGVDYLEQNIEVCRALASENPDINVIFEVGKIEDVVSRLTGHSFDLVLGLSVFHHLIHEHGAPEVVGMLNKILDVSSICIFEFALRIEPLYWGSSQPEDPRSLLEGAAFVHEVSRYPTHLADIERPLFVASNSYWCFGSLLGVIESATCEPHGLAGGAHRGTRRYFFSEEHFIKVFTLDGELGERNNNELTNEAHFLENPPAGFDVPKLYLSGNDGCEAWLVMERLRGELLLDVILRKESYNIRKILIDVLEQAAVLESHGMFHDDLRVWNVFLDENFNARLIDFGSIGVIPKDCDWPHNIFLSF